MPPRNGFLISLESGVLGSRHEPGSWQELQLLVDGSPLSATTGVPGKKERR